MPVYVIERRFAEQLEMSNDEVNLLEDINADEGVSWLYSFLSADRHRTYCLYEAPSPDAIVAAAKRAGIPADVVTEVSRITANTFRCPSGDVVAVASHDYQLTIPRTIRMTANPAAAISRARPPLRASQLLTPATAAWVPSGLTM